MGWTLNRDEADWLKERILVSAPHSYLAYLLKDGLETDPRTRLVPWSTRRLPRRRAEFKERSNTPPVLARDQRGGADLQPTDRREVRLAGGGWQQLHRPLHRAARHMGDGDGSQPGQLRKVGPHLVLGNRPPRTWWPAGGTRDSAIR